MSTTAPESAAPEPDAHEPSAADESESSNTPPPGLPALRLSTLRIENFKAIDELELEFPLPELPGEPDVFVLGSANGVGKTSVLEACALFGLLHSGIAADAYSGGNLRQQREPFFSLLRRGAEDASIAALLTRNLGRAGQYGSQSNVGLSAGGAYRHEEVALRTLPPSHDVAAVLRLHADRMLRRALAEEPEPVVMPGFLYFHAFRRVRGGRVSMGELSGSAAATPVSLFKQAALTALMSRSGLFEDGQAGAAEEVDQLNGLLKTYARGRLGKLARDAEGHIDLRIEPVSGGPSLSFDGLSSGQKEVISTFFLIWYHTRNQPALVLVDEPELHLNAEWQRPWVSTLTTLAPWNQYLLATHSEEIFASVRPERRLILRAD